jgi:hypothetical protein
MTLLSDLPRLLEALPEELRAAAARIWAVDVGHGRLDPPATMEPWIARHFGSLAAVREQAVVTVLNRLTLEGALFNPLRAQRPSGSHGSDADLERWIADELDDDVFAAPLRDTPADVFGRIAGRFCVTASNIAKYDSWHGLVVPHEPHPLRFGREQIRDYLDVALRWVAAVRTADPGACYPLITWNCLPKSGATIVHGHWQIVVARSLAYARVDSWRRAAESYRAGCGRDYFADLAALHQALGLDLGLAGVAGFAHLTPLRNREVVLMLLPEQRQAQLQAGSQQVGRLADALSDVLRAMVDRMGTRAFNMAIALPPDTTAALAEDWSGFPVLVRIGDRGPALTHRNDLGAMELYGTGVIAEDPFKAAGELRDAL